MIHADTKSEAGRAGYTVLEASNQPPVVDAGPPRAITLPATAELEGSVERAGRHAARQFQTAFVGCVELAGCDDAVHRQHRHPASVVVPRVVDRVALGCVAEG